MPTSIDLALIGNCAISANTRQRACADEGLS